MAREGRPFDVAREMRKLTLSIIARALFNVDLKDEHAVEPAIEEICSTGGCQLKLLYAYLPILRRKFRGAVQSLDDLAQRAIAAHRSEFTSRS